MLHSPLGTIYNTTRHGVAGVGNWGKRLGLYSKELGQWVNRNRRDLLHIVTAVIVGMLFMGMISAQNKSHQLIAGETTIINNQSAQISQQKREIASLGAHVDCLFILAQQSNHNTAYIAQSDVSNPNICGIVTPPELAAPSNSSATAPQNSQNTTNTNTGQSGATTTPQDSQNNSGNSTPTPKQCTAKIPLVCL